ncbi:hypothetical protein Tco_1489983, partial [Tanacetum coccineum]
MNANLRWRDLPSMERHAYCESFNETLKELMKLEYLHSNGDVFTDYSWERALSIEDYIYPEWLCGREHVLTLPKFKVLLGLYEESELEYRLFDLHFSKLEIDDKLFKHDEYWRKIRTPTRTNRRTSLIKEPLMRIVHRLIVRALVHRLGSKERCQKRDLWMMSALEESHDANLAWVIAEHLCKHASKLKE